MTHPNGTAGDEMIRAGTAAVTTVPPLDAAHVALVRCAAAIAVAGEAGVREALLVAASAAPADWVEEVILQSYLFAGFPRTLNAAREWRLITGRSAPLSDDGEHYADAPGWREEGERTCAVVYGAAYDRLRRNIRALHPALDAWMIVEGYGKVLSRPQLALRQRELCIVAVCAAAGQDRQLHAHLRGALHAGATPAEVSAALDAVYDLMAPDQPARYRILLDRVLHHDVH